MAFPVVFQIRARADVAAVVSWHTKRGEPSADRWRTGFLTAVLTKLEGDPHRYPAAEEETFGPDFRELLYGRKPHVYRVLFSIHGGTVYVHRVRHAAQDRLGERDV